MTQPCDVVGIGVNWALYSINRMQMLAREHEILA